MAWSDIWKTLDNVQFEGATYRWFFYKKLLDGYNLRNKTVLEIGCGTGINSILMALSGAKVTFLDSSKEALRIVKKTLDKFSLDGELLCENAFYHEFESEFDLVHSEGVVEHFKGEYRQEIVDVHSRATKNGGKVLIIAPNLKCPPYRLGKFFAEKTGTWIYGNEYPYSKKELEFRMEKSGISIEKSQGAEFAFSPGWLFSPLWQNSPSFLKMTMEASVRKGVASLNYSSSFLNGWGVVIGAIGKKLR